MSARRRRQKRPRGKVMTRSMLGTELVRLEARLLAVTDDLLAVRAREYVAKMARYG